ncbi:unnamed protein product [Linum trigynum]|uniref:Uncharacterized protein n=1 Tax=Linum trigynum TaxID=586398 RepID=A0AAV2CCC3_9ROSI
MEPTEERQIQKNLMVGGDMEIDQDVVPNNIIRGLSQMGLSDTHDLVVSMSSGTPAMPRTGNMDGRDKGRGYNKKSGRGSFASSGRGRGVVPMGSDGKQTDSGQQVAPTPAASTSKDAKVVTDDHQDATDSILANAPQVSSKAFRMVAPDPEDEF